MKIQFWIYLFFALSIFLLGIIEVFIGFYYLLVIKEFFPLLKNIWLFINNPLSNEVQKLSDIMEKFNSISHFFMSAICFICSFPLFYIVVDILLSYQY